MGSKKNSKMSFMTTNDFETICQVNEPMTPERSNNERVPPMLTRQRNVYVYDN